MELRKDCQCGDGFNALMGLSCYHYDNYLDTLEGKFQCPHGLELLRLRRWWLGLEQKVSMPSWAWVVTASPCIRSSTIHSFQCPHGLELLRAFHWWKAYVTKVSMPSWAWVVTKIHMHHSLKNMFQCPHGLELLLVEPTQINPLGEVSMPSWAWVVTLWRRWYLEIKGFNALMGLSCYGKNVQYFKFFMILFMHPCYL